MGVSAQRAGLHSATGLRLWSPSRYGALDATAGNTITDDSLSYDIFSQAVKAIRSPAGLDPLGPLAAPEYVVATGHSQSAGRLRTYANSIQPLANILDAVVLHGGGGAMRTDTPMPVFRINSEGDISFGIGNGARAPDSPTFRNWEVAGASHGDWKLITDYGPLRKRDIGTYPGGYPGEPQTCTLPSLSRVPQHMVQNAVYDHTLNWVAYGIDPPSAPVISTATPAGGAIVRDSLGLAEGGIRLSQHEVPLRVNSGSNSGGGFCALDGSSVPLSDAQLATLYPTVQGYVDEVVAVTLANAAKGYIPADFTRDPAWYTDIRDLVNEYGARISNPARLKASLAEAEKYGTAGDHYTAIFFLEDVANQVQGDAAARDARPAPHEGHHRPAAGDDRRPDLDGDAGDRRRHRARHAVADARRAGDVRRLHAGRHAGVHGRLDGHRHQQRGRRDALLLRPRSPDQRRVLARAAAARRARQVRLERPDEQRERRHHVPAARSTRPTRCAPATTAGRSPSPCPRRTRRSGRPVPRARSSGAGR